MKSPNKKIIAKRTPPPLRKTPRKSPITKRTLNRKTPTNSNNKGSPTKSKVLPKGTRFIRGSGNYKYTAIIPMGNGEKRVSFGAKGYQQYKDSVPKSMGGGLYSNLDHNDNERRNRYRERHSGIIRKDGSRAIDVKFSPAWFSYYYLW